MPLTQAFKILKHEGVPSGKRGCRRVRLEIVMQMARDILDSEQLEKNPHVNLIVASQKATHVHPEVDVVHQQGPSFGLEN